MGKVYEMKIIKAGVIPEKFWWIGKHFSCNKCKCVFELEEGDILSNTSEFRYDCPTCKSTLRLKRPQDVFKADTTAIFEEVFGKDGSIFADLFGKPKI